MVIVIFADGNISTMGEPAHHYYLRSGWYTQIMETKVSLLLLFWNKDIANISKDRPYLYMHCNVPTIWNITQPNPDLFGHYALGLKRKVFCYSSDWQICLQNLICSLTSNIKSQSVHLSMTILTDQPSCRGTLQTQQTNSHYLDKSSFHWMNQLKYMWWWWQIWKRLQGGQAPLVSILSEIPLFWRTLWVKYPVLLRKKIGR